MITTTVPSKLLDIHRNCFGRRNAVGALFSLVSAKSRGPAPSLREGVRFPGGRSTRVRFRPLQYSLQRSSFRVPSLWAGSQASAILLETARGSKALRRQLGHSGPERRCPHSRNCNTKRAVVDEAVEPAQEHGARHKRFRLRLEGQDGDEREGIERLRDFAGKPRNDCPKKERRNQVFTFEIVFPDWWSRVAHRGLIT